MMQLALVVMLRDRPLVIPTPLLCSATPMKLSQHDGTQSVGHYPSAQLIASSLTGNS